MSFLNRATVVFRAEKELWAEEKWIVVFTGNTVNCLRLILFFLLRSLYLMDQRWQVRSSERMKWTQLENIPFSRSSIGGEHLVCTSSNITIRVPIEFFQGFHHLHFHMIRWSITQCMQYLRHTSMTMLESDEDRMVDWPVPVQYRLDRWSFPKLVSRKDQCPLSLDMDRSLSALVFERLDHHVESNLKLFGYLLCPDRGGERLSLINRSWRIFSGSNTNTKARPLHISAFQHA